MRWYISAKLSRFALSRDCAASKFGLQKNPGHPPHFRTQHINTRQKNPKKHPALKIVHMISCFPLTSFLCSVLPVHLTHPVIPYIPCRSRHLIRPLKSHTLC